MAYDQDAVDAAVALLRPLIEANTAAIDTLQVRVEQLEARPAGGATLSDRALWRMQEALAVRVNDAPDDAGRAAIIDLATAALS